MYPPYPHSAEELISFYESQTPTEEQLGKFVDGYGELRRNWVKSQLVPIDIRLDQRFGADPSEKKTEERQKALTSLEDEHPTHMNPLFAREIARAVQIERFSDALDPQERERALSHEITMPNGQKSRVDHLADRYMSREYQEFLI